MPRPKLYPEYVDVECPSCEQNRSVKRQTVMRPTFTSLCKSCSGLQRRGGGNGRYMARGYVLITGQYNHPYAHGNGAVLEHRLVMEQKLGRYLEPYERVHHIDGDKANNHPSNLELWTLNHPSGIRVLDTVKNLTKYFAYGGLLPVLLKE